MIITEQRGENKADVAYDRRSSGAASKLDSMIQDGITGKVSFPQQDLAEVDASIGTEAANAIDVACQLRDPLGNAMLGVRRVVVETLAVTDSGGDLAAATSAVGTIRKTLNPATGWNIQWMETDAQGRFSFKSTNAAQELTTVRITGHGVRPTQFDLNFAAV